MARKVNVTCEYYYVKSYTDEDRNALYDLQHWIAKIQEEALASRIKPIGNEYGRVEELRINEENEIFSMNFVKMEAYSSTYIVKKNAKAKHVDIDVDADEYIGKNTVVLYDAERHIAMVMKNRGGFSAYTITNYINSFYAEPVCFFEPIKFKPDFFNPSKKFGKIEIKITNTREFTSTSGVIYEEALRKAADMDAETFAFEVTSSRKKSGELDPEMARVILTDAIRNMGIVSIAKVRMSDEHGTAIYNLFENVKKDIIRMEADSKGEVSYVDLSREMMKMYYKSIEEY